MLGDGESDYRDFFLSYVECDVGDLLFIATDGVHLNFDPKYLGVQPSDCGLTTKWWSQELDADQLRLVRSHMCRRVAEALGDDSGGGDAIGASRRIIDACLSVTEESRRNRAMIGYLNHATVVVGRVGRFEAAALAGNESLPPQIASCPVHFERAPVDDERWEWSVFVPRPAGDGTATLPDVWKSLEARNGALAERLRQVRDCRNLELWRFVYGNTTALEFRLQKGNLLAVRVRNAKKAILTEKWASVGALEITQGSSKEALCNGLRRLLRQPANQQQVKVDSLIDAFRMIDPKASVVLFKATGSQLHFADVSVALKVVTGCVLLWAARGTWQL